MNKLIKTNSCFFYVFVLSIQHFLAYVFPEISSVFFLQSIPTTIRRSWCIWVAQFLSHMKVAGLSNFNITHFFQCLYWQKQLKYVSHLYKGGKYNIPVCIWIHETHPKNPPRCYVCPSASMIINTKSSNVDANGRVLLHCLSNWKIVSQLSNY